MLKTWLSNRLNQILRPGVFPGHATLKVEPYKLVVRGGDLEVSGLCRTKLNENRPRKGRVIVTKIATQKWERILAYSE